MRSILSRWLSPQEGPLPLETGVYHYQAAPDSPVPYRLHLRIEPGDRGVLIVNAATVLHLNPTATAHALQLVQGETTQAAAQFIANRYNVSRKRAGEDHEALRAKILALATNPDIDPVLFLDLERKRPYEGTLSAPYRLDCALTYATDPDGSLDPLARARVDKELSTDEWKKILRTAWQAGIPHVTFTGGEPTRREDLAELIQYAEELGQVTGVLTEGRRLKDQAYVHALEQAGLDHFLIVFLPDEPDNLAGIKQALASDIYTALHVTLEHKSQDYAHDLLQQVEALGATAVSLSAPAAQDEMAELLKDAGDFATSLHLDLIWDLPAPHSQNNPIAVEVEEKQIEGAGQAWLYVEPDGDVLPAQGVNEILGNFLRDSWDSIWEKARQR